MTVRWDPPDEARVRADRPGLPPRSTPGRVEDVRAAPHAVPRSPGCDAAQGASWSESLSALVIRPSRPVVLTNARNSDRFICISLAAVGRRRRRRWRTSRTSPIVGIFRLGMCHPDNSSTSRATAAVESLPGPPRARVADPTRSRASGCRRVKRSRIRRADPMESHCAGSVADRRPARGAGAPRPWGGPG